jgi:hypothetical protein
MPSEKIIQRVSFRTVCRLALFILIAASTASHAEKIIEINQNVPAFEASDLLWVENPKILESQRWDRAFWTVSDEKRVEGNMALVGHKTGRSMETGWEVLPVKCAADALPQTDDSEGMCRQGECVYIIGSHFGKKAGPLTVQRQFIARFRENSIAVDGSTVTVDMDAVVDDFLIHRLINDRLAVSEQPLIEETELERSAFIFSARNKGLKKSVSWISRIHDTDWPLNIEGAEFLDSGNLLLGLRYPVTREGHPILVELQGVEALMTGQPGSLKVARLWTIENMGAKDRLLGVRALRKRGDELHAVLGSIDGRKEMSLLLQEHPAGAAPDCVHVRMTLPAPGSTKIQAESLRTFSGLSDVEGLAFDPAGRAFYIRDDVGNIPLLIGDAPAPK